MVQSNNYELANKWAPIYYQYVDTSKPKRDYVMRNKF